MLLLLAALCGRADVAADKLTAAGVAEFTNACRTWDGERFDAAVALFQRACAGPSATATNFYWLGAAQFHRMLELLGRPGTDTNKVAAAAALDAAADALNRAVKLDPCHAESHALLATVYGMEIGANLLRAVWLGPRLQKELKFALATGTSNARVEYLLGTSQFFMACRASTRRAALTTLLTAERLFDAEAKVPPGPLEPRWGRDSCLTFIASCYEKLDARAEAETYFRKALVLHPEDGLAQAGLKRVTKGKQP